MDRSRSGEGGWRACLAAYVHGLNRLEAGAAADWDDLAEDAAILEPCLAKARRLAGRREQNRPVHAETRCRPLGTVGRDRACRVRVRLMRRWVYGDGRVEERVEHEKLDFAFRKGRWMLAGLSPETPERLGGGKPWSAPFDPGPVPYINRDVLAPREGALRRRAMRAGTAAGMRPGRRETGLREAARTIRYDREAARAYADRWWNAANPKYHHFAVDCTNYVSQCLFAGGLPMDYTGRRDSGWWYEGYAGGAERWSFSWAVAHSLQLYLLAASDPKRGTEKADPRELAVGDVISYDWDGDGRWQHTAIVTGHDREGWPLVNAHTNNSKNRFWDYRDSYAWSARTRYTFIHVPDEL